MPITYRKGYKYQLAADVKIAVPMNMPSFIRRFFEVRREGGHNVLTIREGYAWDGLTGAADTEGGLFGSLVHDVGCQATDEGHLDYSWRKWFDDKFRDLVESNMKARPGKWRRVWAVVRSRYAHAAVRWFSKRNAKKHGPKPVLEAPSLGAM